MKNTNIMKKFELYFKINLTIKGKNVCVVCFDDLGIQSFIKAHNNQKKCSYCEILVPDANIESCDLTQVVQHIFNSMLNEWTPCIPDSNAIHELETTLSLDTVQLLYQQNLYFQSDDLFEDICEALPNLRWNAIGALTLPDEEVWMTAWDRFCWFVKNKSRYFFLEAPGNSYLAEQKNEINPVEILEILAGFIKDFNMLSDIKLGTHIHRVRIVGPHWNSLSEHDITPPPARCATTANRMSPVGIPMFYGAFDLETAICETYVKDSEDVKVFCGVFTPTRTLKMIDLSISIDIPTPFDPTHGNSRGKLKFLSDFITDFTKPIDRHDGAHIDYIPTQIVTEYFRYIFKTKDNLSIDGIIYPSSKAIGRKAVVIFADKSQCLPQDHQSGNRQILKIESTSSRIIKGTESEPEFKLD